MELVIVTGQSGAGKSHAVQCLEDLGYYCVDNLPPALFFEFLELVKNKSGIEKLAFVADIRGREFFKDLSSTLEDLKKKEIKYQILFLEASTPVLLRRYQETRRIHPLAKDANNEKGIESEKKMLEPLKKKADFIIDTSNLKAAGLNAEIKRLIDDVNEQDFEIAIQSFGYKKGLPPEADWVLDVRFVPNPFYVASLKNLTGKNKKVKEFVLGYSDTQDFIAKVTGMIIDLIPKYVHEGKYHLSIAFGCTGGRHRSVAIAEEVAAHLRECGEKVTLSHREIG